MDYVNKGTGFQNLKTNIDIDTVLYTALICLRWVRWENIIIWFETRSRCYFISNVPASEHRRGHMKIALQILRYAEDPSQLWTSHEGVRWISNVHLSLYPSLCRWQQVIVSRLINKPVYKRERKRKRDLLFAWPFATPPKTWLVFWSHE